MLDKAYRMVDVFKPVPFVEPEEEYLMAAEREEELKKS